jgi:hypothetical protein
VEDISISTSNSPVRIISASTVTFNSGDRGLRDCITKLTFSGDNFGVSGTSITVLSAGTTFYTMSWTTGTIVDFWDFQNPLCSPNVGVPTFIYVSTGNYKFSAVGFKRNK